MNAFPDAKVVLSVRNPESWFKSFDDIVLKAMEAMNSIPMQILMTLLSPRKEQLVGKTALKIWLVCVFL